MPFGPNDTIRSAGARKYQGKQRRAFKSAFNACHAKGHEEARCFKIAHTAAKRAGAA